MTTQQKESLAGYCLVAAIVVIFNLVYVKRQLAVMEMNGINFTSVGMIQYPNPKGGENLYLPIYQRIPK